MISQRDVVLLKFPFSDLRSSKVRPALVLSNDDYNSRFEDFCSPIDHKSAAERVHNTNHKQ